MGDPAESLMSSPLAEPKESYHLEKTWSILVRGRSVYGMPSGLDKLMMVAEGAVRAGKLVKELRKNGQNGAADMLEQECDRLCKSVVSTARRRARNAKKAAAKPRSASGRFRG